MSNDKNSSVIQFLQNGEEDFCANVIKYFIRASNNLFRLHLTGYRIEKKCDVKSASIVRAKMYKKSKYGRDVVKRSVTVEVRLE
jgi:hypothetical protein